MTPFQKISQLIPIQKIKYNLSSGDKISKLFNANYSIYLIPFATRKYITISQKQQLTLNDYSNKIGL